MVFCILLWLSGQKHAFFYKSITTTCCKYLKFNITCRYLKEKSTLNISFLKNKIANEHCVPFYSCAKLHSGICLVTWELKSSSLTGNNKTASSWKWRCRNPKGTNPKQMSLHFYVSYKWDLWHKWPFNKKRRVAVPSLNASKLLL